MRQTLYAGFFKIKKALRKKKDAGTQIKFIKELFKKAISIKFNTRRLYVKDLYQFAY